MNTGLKQIESRKNEETLSASVNQKQFWIEIRLDISRKQFRPRSGPTITSSEFISDFGKLPFPSHLGKYIIKNGKISTKIHEIGKKAILDWECLPYKALKWPNKITDIGPGLDPNFLIPTEVFLIMLLFF